MSGVSVCPIWGTEAKQLESSRDGHLFISPRAGGKYFISGTAEKMIGNVDDFAKARLTTWLIDERNQGTDAPEVMSSMLENLGDRAQLSVQDRTVRLLELLSHRTGRLGATVNYRWGDSISEELFAWSESTHVDEVSFLLGVLEERGHIHSSRYMGGANIKVLVAGYEWLDELSRTIALSTQGFVAMWFDPTMDGIHLEGIAAGIADAGYLPLRIDRKAHNNKIDDEIIAEIRRSRFLVADFTHGDGGPRGGVYYEAGFAHGLGIPVIFTVRADMISQAHFDTRQYAHILWTDAADLRKKLADRISATIGDGPSKAPATR